jgi:prepilin-type N-terminal cleavage/methylation domain-containing protein
VRNKTECHSEEGYKGSSAAVCTASIGSASPRRSGFARPPARNPRGFTLVEVIVASAILMILLLTLMGSFAAGVSGFKQAQQMTFAQNLGEFLAEDLKARPPGVLQLLCEGKWNGVSESVRPAEVALALSNYPLPLDGDSDAQDSNARPFEYDSGRQRTDFNITGVDLVTGIDADGNTFAYQAGEDVKPTSPTDPPLLLGSNVKVESYEVRDPSEPYDPAKSKYYYVVKLHKEAYPLFTKQVRVVCYDSWMPTTVDPWTHVAGDAVAYHFMSAPYTGAEDSMTAYPGEKRAVYGYIITIRYERGSTSRVLYETRGVISAPYEKP